MLSYAQTSEIYQTAKSIISDFEIPNIALANYSVATADDGVAIVDDVSDSSDSLTFQNFTYTVDNSQVTITGYTGEETEITVPSEIDGMKVTTIGGSAFSGKPLTNIIIQEGVTTIKYGAFSRCTALKNITLPESLTEIGNQVFEECSALESIIIPDGVTAIEWNTFYKCSSLQSVVLPEGLTFIGMDAFYSCKSLQSVVLPKDLKTIGAAAFESCIALESITLPEGLTLIEFNAFLFCKSLKSIIIPDSVTRIEHDAFSNCTALESVKLPKGLTLIESGLFNKCKSLKSITIPESVTNIKSSAFKGSGLESITIPEGITLISTDLFYECESLTSVKFPESLTSIAEGAFYGCKALESITIPQNVTSIGRMGFYNCQLLKNITLPEGLTSIGELAFYYCLALESITIPKGVTTIENCTFYQCKSLTSITLPEGVKNIGNYAFYQCIDLEAIYMPYSMEEIGTGVFMESPNVTMYVYKDTVSEQYAIDNNIPYQYRDYIDAIVILPGIMGSRLFFNNDLYYEGSIVWEPISKGVTTTDGIQQTVYNLKKLDSYLSDENRDSNFTVKPPQNQQFLKIHEESEEAYGLEYREYGALNTYKDLIDDLCESTDRPVYLFNYDWTKSNADSADKLKEFLEPFDHVDLICHSMGGIVASNYMSKYKSDGKIDRIVTCGTPYEGSPVMINKMMNWDILENDDADAFLSMDKDRVMNVFSDVALGLVGGLSKEAKLSIISTSELFPTENYVLRVPFYKKEDVLSFDEYKAICSDIYEKVGRDYNDAISFQESIKGSTGYNNLLDYDKSYFLMGTNQKTITSVVFKKDDISSTSHEDDLGYDDLGDGTVPYYSLTMCKKIMELPKDRYCFANGSHNGTLKEVKLINSDVTTLEWIKSKIGIGDENNTLADNVIAQAPVSDGFNVLRVACPVDVNIESNGEVLDSSASSFDTYTSFGRLDIIGENDEIKMACIDKNEEYDVTLEGTDDGTMDYTVRYYETADDLQSETTISDVPITKDTVITTKVDSADEIVLNVDSDGDGTVEKTYTAPTGETVDVSNIVKFNPNNGDQEIKRAVDSEGKLNYTPEAPTKEGYTFVGWFKDTDDTTTKYKSGATYDKDTTYVAKWVHVDMLGAQVKAIVNDKSGIRFGTKVYNDGDKIVEKGTIIIPLNLIPDGQSLTLATPQIAKSVGKVNYEVNKPENYVIYLGTLVSIDREQFDTPITASSYVTYEDKAGNEYTVYAPYKKGSTTVNTLLGN